MCIGDSNWIFTILRIFRAVFTFRMGWIGSNKSGNASEKYKKSIEFTMLGSLLVFREGYKEEISKKLNNTLCIYGRLQQPK